MRDKCTQRREESWWSDWESLLDKAVGEMYAEADDEDVEGGGCVVGPGGRQSGQPQSDREQGTS